jgi:hypothetical protein
VYLRVTQEITRLNKCLSKVAGARDYSRPVYKAYAHFTIAVQLAARISEGRADVLTLRRKRVNDFLGSSESMEIAYLLRTLNATQLTTTKGNSKKHNVLNADNVGMKVTRLHFSKR